MRIRVFFSTHVIFFFILAVATLLRFHDISRQMIFIGDQGRDFFVARKMVTQGTVPLLGIPSSIPRFAQGPLYIYWLAFIYWISSGSVILAGMSAALLGVGAVVALYVLLGTYHHWWVATIAAAVYGLSPMLLLHSRMPYHINPIPVFFLVYVWQLMRLWEQKRGSGFFAGLAFGLLFQFELAAFPLLLLIPAVLVLRSIETDPTEHRWALVKRTLRELRIAALPTLAGTSLGLLPQIIHDFTHGFTQLGGFLLWVGYRLTAALVPFSRHSLLDLDSGQKISQVFSLYLEIFSQNGWKIDALLWAVIIPLCALLLLRSWVTSARIEQLSVVAYVIMAISFLIHRVPSEAYMPLMAGPAVLVLVSGLKRLHLYWRVGILGAMILSLLFSLVRIESARFYLLQPHESHWSQRRFGPSLQTQRLVVNTLYRLSQERCIFLESEERNRTFPSTFDHIEYLLAIDGNRPRVDCVRIRIDRPDAARKYWESTRGIVDLGVYWVQMEENEPRFAYHNSL